MSKKIKILEGGPYLVSADVPIKINTIECASDGLPDRWAEIKTYDTHDKPYALCRCGRSKTKPFCDGAHTSCRWNKEETAQNIPYMQSAQKCRGARADLMDKEELCAVARFCDRHGQVWNLIEKDDEASLNLAIKEASNCPAGRLTVVRDGRAIEPRLPQEISAVQDPALRHRGPLWVKGGIELEGAKGVKYETRNRMTLCRCGESSNMPFCDATHLHCPHMKGADE
jgi:CDGSH-type Zn-finger protein